MNINLANIDFAQGQGEGSGDLMKFVYREEPDTSTDGTYVLKATVLNGEVRYEWVLDV